MNTTLQDERIIVKGILSSITLMSGLKTANMLNATFARTKRDELLLNLINIAIKLSFYHQMRHSNA